MRRWAMKISIMHKLKINKIMKETRWSKKKNRGKQIIKKKKEKKINEKIYQIILYWKKIVNNNCKNNKWLN